MQVVENIKKCKKKIHFFSSRDLVNFHEFEEIQEICPPIPHGGVPSSPHVSGPRLNSYSSGITKQSDNRTLDIGHVIQRSEVRSLSEANSFTHMGLWCHLENTDQYSDYHSVIKEKSLHISIYQSNEKHIVHTM